MIVREEATIIDVDWLSFGDRLHCERLHLIELAAEVRRNSPCRPHQSVSKRANQAKWKLPGRLLHMSQPGISARMLSSPLIEGMQFWRDITMETAQRNWLNVNSGQPVCERDKRPQNCIR